MWALREVWIAPSAPREALARIQAAATPGRACSPAALESGLQLLAALVHGPDDPPVDGELFAARALEELTLLAPGAEIGWVHAALREPAGPSFGATGDLRFHDPEGRLVALLRGVDVGPPDRDLARRALFARLDTWLHAIRWQPGAPADPRPEAPGVWLILPDAGGLAERLADRLDRPRRAPACTCTTSTTSPPPCATPAPAVRCGPSSTSAASTAAPDGRRPPRAHRRRGRSTLLHLAQTLARAGAATAGSHLLTRGAQPVDRRPARRSRAGPLWGLARTIRLEHPELPRQVCSTSTHRDTCGRARRPSSPSSTTPAPRTSIAHRDGDLRLVARLVRAGPAADPRAPRPPPRRHLPDHRRPRRRRPPARALARRPRRPPPPPARPPRPPEPVPTAIQPVPTAPIRTCPNSHRPVPTGIRPDLSQQPRRPGSRARRSAA
jgi:hypothetical protein